MHGKCVVESIKLCPYLRGERGYRGDLPAYPNQVATGERPKVTYLLRGGLKAIEVEKPSAGWGVYLTLAHPFIRGDKN